MVLRLPIFPCSHLAQCSASQAHSEISSRGKQRRAENPFIRCSTRCSTCPWTPTLTKLVHSQRGISCQCPCVDHAGRRRRVVPPGRLFGPHLRVREPSLVISDGWFPGIDIFLDTTVATFPLDKVAPTSAYAPGTQSLRFYSQATEKPSLKLIAELRKLTEVSISKAREALAASNNDAGRAGMAPKRPSGLRHQTGRQSRSPLGRVCQWCVRVGPRAQDGLDIRPWWRARRAGRAQQRDGLCFVAWNALFSRLAADITHAAAFLGSGACRPQCRCRYRRRSQHQQKQRFPDVPRARLEAPLLPAEGPAPSPAAALLHGTVEGAVRAAIAKLG